MSYETAPIRGIEEHYGTRVTNGKFGGDFGTKDGTRQKVYTYVYNDVPAADANNLVLNIPAYGKVLNVYTEILEDITLGGDRTGATVQIVAGSYDSGADAFAALTRGTAVKDEPTAPTSVGSSSAEVAITLAATGGTSGSITGGKFRTTVEYAPEGV